MHAHRLTALTLGRKRAVVRLTALGALTGALAAATPASGAVLLDRFDAAATTETSSQNFEASSDSFDSEAADDVINREPNTTWKVKEVLVKGEYFTGTGPAASVNVAFYRGKGVVPTTLAYSAPAIIPSAGLDTGNFVIPLPEAAKLGAGKRYWLSVQANLDFGSGGHQWGWRNRYSQTDMEAVWRNPGDAFGTGCTTFAPRRTTCGLYPDGPDQVFKLKGKIIVP